MNSSREEGEKSATGDPLLVMMTVTGPDRRRILYYDGFTLPVLPVIGDLYAMTEGAAGDCPGGLYKVVEVIVPADLIPARLKGWDHPWQAEVVLTPFNAASNPAATRRPLPCWRRRVARTVRPPRKHPKRAGRTA